MENYHQNGKGIEHLKLKSMNLNMETQRESKGDPMKCLNNNSNTKEDNKDLTVQGKKSQDHPTRTLTPRRVKDIHLDGTVDDMQNVDPYMLDEKDLDIQSEVGGHAGTVSSNVSVSSWKSLHLPKSKETKSVVSSIDRSDTSRARRLKQHERSPFLSIDIPSETNSARSINHRAMKSKSPLYGSQHSLLSVSTSALTSQHSARSSVADRTSSARHQGRKLFSSSSLLPPGSLPHHPNHNIKKPFKHDVKDVELAVPPVSPATDLKDRTALATHAINKILRAQKPSKTHYIQGRLLKARLKPLEPVKLTEPTIQQCRGIISETRKYSQCDSRTLQRWRAIMSGAHVQPHQEAVREGASTSESIHRTSEASTPDLAMANADDLDVSLFEDKIWMDELNVLMKEGRDSADEGERIIPFTSLPHSRSEPAHCGEELSIIQGPDFESMDEQGVTPKPENTDESMTEKDEDIDAHPKTEPYRDSSKKEPSSESVISATTEESLRKFSDDTESFDLRGSFVSGSLSKRPHSATYPQESVMPRTSSILRPKTAVDSSHKAVRFADEDMVKNKGSLENDVSGKRALKPKGNKGKSSCRPHSLDSGFDDKDEPGDENGRGGRVRTFLTQDPPKSMASEGSVTSGMTVNSSQQEGKSKKANGSGKFSCKADDLKPNASSGSDRSSLQKSGSSQNIDASHDGHTSLLGEQSYQDMRDNPVTASVVYNDIKVSENSSTCGISRSSPRGEQKLMKESPKKEKKVSKAKDEAEFEELLPTEGKNPLQAEVNTEDESPSTDVTILQVRGDKLNISESDQKPKPTVHPQDFDYNKYNRAQSKRTTSSARRAKAYQNLIKKTRKQNSPLNNAFIGQAMEKSYSKDRRSQSASNFSERSSIQSKYGLLNTKASPSSAPTLQPDRTSRKQVPKRRNSKSERNLHEAPLEDENSNKGLDLKEEQSERKVRPKSVSKVTFADENDWRVGRRRQNSATSTVKSYPKKSSSSFGSCDSLFTHHTSSVSDDGILGADFNRMWDEIPSYDSDEDENEDDVGEQEADFELLSKFDDLETQFEQLKSEMAEARQKLISNSLASHDDKWLIATEGREPEAWHASPHSETSSKNIQNLETLLPMNLTEDVMEVHNSDSIFVTSEPDEEYLGKKISPPPSDQKNEVITSNSVNVESTNEASLVISSSLYKKTNLYVEVSKSSSSSKQRSRSQSQSQSSSQKSKAMKCVPIEDVALSHADEKADTESRLLNLEGAKSERPTSASKKDVKQTVISVAVPTKDHSKSEDVQGDDKQEKLHLSHKRSMSPGQSQKSKTDPSETKSQGKSGKIENKQKRNHSTSSSRTKKIPMTKHQKQPKKVTEYKSYSDILLAYRQHCMEDSDGEQEEEEEEEENSKQLDGCLDNLNVDPENAAAYKGFEENEHRAYQPEKWKTLDVDHTIKIAISESDERIEAQVKDEGNRIVLVNNKTDMTDKRLTVDEKADEIPCNKNQLKKNVAARSSESNSNNLEIVAKPKVLSKIRKPTVLPDGDMETLCKFPPLCFQLNAKPPAGFFYYFAYDQNMNPDRLATYLNVATPPSRFWALLFGFKLVFNMKVPTLNDIEGAGGQANILYTPDASVEGCVYQLTLQQLASLDKFMGYPQHFEHVVLPVWMSNCLDSHDLGLAQYCVPALTYVAHDCCTCQEPVYPNSFAVEQCLKSADILSSQYKEHIQSFLPSDIPVVKAIEVA